MLKTRRVRDDGFEMRESSLFDTDSDTKKKAKRGGVSGRNKRGTLLFHF